MLQSDLYERWNLYLSIMPLTVTVGNGNKFNQINGFIRSHKYKLSHIQRYRWIYVTTLSFWDCTVKSVIYATSFEKRLVFVDKFEVIELGAKRVFDNQNVWQKKKPVRCNVFYNQMQKVNFWIASLAHNLIWICFCFDSQRP